MNYIVLCECAEGPERHIVAWINDLRPTYEHVSITGTKFRVTRRGRRSKAGSRALYTLACPGCGKKNPPLAENTVTAIIDMLKSQAAQLETVIARGPTDDGVPRPGWHPTAAGPEPRLVIGFALLKKISSQLGKRGVK